MNHHETCYGLIEGFRCNRRIEMRAGTSQPVQRGLIAHYVTHLNDEGKVDSGEQLWFCRTCSIRIRLRRFRDGVIRMLTTRRDARRRALEADPFADD